MRRSTIALLLLLGVAACATRAATQARTVETMLDESGFRTLAADTPGKLEHLEKLTPRRLTMVSRQGKPYYYFADPKGCRCLYFGGEAAYRRYDALAQARDDVASDAADRKMLRTVESVEETPPDPWQWQELLPEYFPQ